VVPTTLLQLHIVSRCLPSGRYGVCVCSLACGTQLQLTDAEVLDVIKTAKLALGTAPMMGKPPPRVPSPNPRVSVARPGAADNAQGAAPDVNARRGTSLNHLSAEDKQAVLHEVVNGICVALAEPSDQPGEASAGENQQSGAVPVALLLRKQLDLAPAPAQEERQE